MNMIMTELFDSEMVYAEIDLQHQEFKREVVKVK